MRALNYSQLFLVRYGYCKTDTLSKEGREQMERTAEIISSLLVPETIATPFSAVERRAIDSLFVLEDALASIKKLHRKRSASLGWAITGYCLAGASEDDFKQFIRLANKNRSKGEEICLAVAHKKMVERFPSWYLQENFERDFPYYNFEYGDGVLIEIKTGDYKIISPKLGVVNL